MKREKGEERVMRPMFPRLHVNDTEKGGPRAPPRNKMALYEQLSIPSQRFNPGDLPLNNNSNTVPPYSSQGNEHERGVLFLRQLPELRHSVEKPHGRSCGSNTPLQKVESRKQTEKNDFRIPTFGNFKAGQGHGKFYNNLDMEKLTPSNQAISGCSNKEFKEITGLITRQLGKIQNGENSKDHAISRKCTSDSLSTDKAEGSLKQTDKLLHFKPRKNHANTFGELQMTNIVRLQFRPDSRVDCTVFAGSAMDVDNESPEDKTCKSSQTGEMDQCDDLSETSMVECVSKMDISPDDIVRIIGQKHFWRARRAIANQQRVLAVQVFELHRLLKVQKLIAGSPNSMLEDSSSLGKPLKRLSTKRLALEYKRKAPENVSKQKIDSEKPNSRMESNAENDVGETSLSCRRPLSETPSSTPVKHDSHMGPLLFNQSSGQQWLIPVMSPSEGLVYKPHPGPAFTSPIYGSCGPPIPMTGNFLAPAYYQRTGAPFAPPPSHGYFPPFGMPVMNPVILSPAIDQPDLVAATGFQGQLSGDQGVNFNIQQQNSSNVARENNGAVPEVVRLYPSRDSELQASTASSPSERGRGVDVGNSTGGRSVFPLFPTIPAISNPDSSPQPHFPSHPARVIKVVPRNASTATESAARIFQYIQEERKQH
ncbi:PREDICTED: protein EARLY FLOWERING 3-like [Nicotiana attenuata]|uniref:Protein early flowering 3 n=1 Tax=Nicotiana attenuata TaxID=49451 RepID=A0A1J6IWX2_NICAT|nr:PREDICTED: protein EARLY FLOWERING 3-like [Nicotiana attenuata]OIT08764.1 protein early flowering 3 [Nicotiana attenuata]